ncbi:hypothetical protein RUND412_009452 [Rhizina undulata]
MTEFSNEESTAGGLFKDKRLQENPAGIHESRPHVQKPEGSHSLGGHPHRQVQESKKTSHEDGDAYFSDSKWKLSVPQENGKSNSTIYPLSRARADKKKAYRRETIVESNTRDYSRRDRHIPSPTITNSTAEDELDVNQLRNSRRNDDGSTKENSNRIGGSGYVRIREASGTKIDLASAARNTTNEAGFQSLPARKRARNSQRESADSGSRNYAPPRKLRIVETETGRAVINVSHEQVTGYSDLATVHQRETDSPVSGSEAMSISNANTPAPSNSPKGDEELRICMKCKRPETPHIDLLVCCSQCSSYVHTSCHNPVLPITRGTINVPGNAWTCQRCIKGTSAPTSPEASRTTSTVQSPQTGTSGEKIDQFDGTSGDIFHLNLNGSNHRQIFFSKWQNNQREEDVNFSDEGMYPPGVYAPIREERYVADTEMRKAVEHSPESPLYDPNVSDLHKTGSDGLQSNPYKSHSNSSSPPYSPPPADIPATTLNVASPLGNQVRNLHNISEPALEFFCRSCNVLVPPGTGNYGSTQCSHCVLQRALKRVSLPNQSARATAQPHQQIASQHVKTVQGNPFLKPYKVGNLSSSTVRSTTPRELSAQLGFDSPETESPDISGTVGTAVPQARKRTSKDLVAERYNMKFAEPEAHNSNSQSKTNTATNRMKRKREASSLPFAVPVRKRDYSQTSETPVKETSRSKIINKDKPTSMDKRQNDVSTSVENSPGLSNNGPSNGLMPGKSLAARKSARTGPAVKNAGGKTRHVIIDSSSSDEEDEQKDDVIESLQKRLSDQKGFTKRQMERCAKTEGKLQKCEQENTKLLASLQALQKEVDSLRSKDKSPQNQTGEELVQCQVLSDRGQESIDSEPVTSLRHLFKEYTITANNPWVEVPRFPKPVPVTVPKNPRQKSWHKSEYHPFDPKKLMNIHLHRQKFAPNKIVGMVMQRTSGGGEGAGNIEDREGSHLSVDREMSFDEFLGVPDHMIPALKDGVLGFRAGIINQRSRLLDRNVQHYRIRTSADIRTNI